MLSREEILSAVTAAQERIAAEAHFGNSAEALAGALSDAIFTLDQCVLVPEVDLDQVSRIPALVDVARNAIGRGPHRVHGLHALDEVTQILTTNLPAPGVAQGGSASRAAEARAERLEAVLRQSLGLDGDQSIIEDNPDEGPRCFFCGEPASIHRQVNHASDCPVTDARDALAPQDAASQAAQTEGME